MTSTRYTTSRVRQLMKAPAFALVEFKEDKTLSIVPTKKIVHGDPIPLNVVSVRWSNGKNYEAVVLMTDDKRKQLETYETALLTEMNQHAQIQQGQSRDPKACKKLNFASEKQKKNLQCEKGSPSKRLRMEEDTGRAGQTNPTEEPSTEEQASGLSATSPGEPAPEQHRATSSTPLNSPMRGSVVVNVPPSPVVIAPCSSNEAIVRRLDALLECVNKIADKLSEKQAVDKEPAATCTTVNPATGHAPELMQQTFIDADIDDGPKYLSEEVLFNEYKKADGQRRRFAARLNRLLFTVEERKKSNVSGSRGKEKLNENIINYIQRQAFRFFSSSPGEKLTEWSTCIKSIDETNRALNKKSKKT